MSETAPKSRITRYVLLSFVLLTWTASPVAAQNTTCDSSQFDKLTNMWKFEPDQNTRDVTPTELAAERKIMQRVADMFKSAFVPTGAVGLYGANYYILEHARLNTNRYGNTYTFIAEQSEDRVPQRQAGRTGRLTR